MPTIDISYIHKDKHCTYKLIPSVDIHYFNMPQQQQQRREDDQFKNRTEDQDKNNDGMFGTGTAADPVAVYAAAGYGVPSGTTTTTRYEYTVYGTTAAAPGFVDPTAVGAGGGGQGRRTRSKC